MLCRFGFFASRKDLLKLLEIISLHKELLELIFKHLGEKDSGFWFLFK